jgi:2-haloacid dehalogenase
MSGRSEGDVALVLFDAYGTLLDVHSGVGRFAGAIGPAAPALSALWRQKQLEYTWTRSLMGRHADFAVVTAEALDFALAAHGIADPALRDALLAAYRTLDAYPEVPDVLAGLRRRRLKTAILSNGAPEMLAAGVAAAGIGDLLDAVLSVEAVGVYKPDPRVYRLATDHFGTAPAATVFVSSNAWDAAGAAAFGFRVAWINRSGQPAEYGFALPAMVLQDLRGLLTQ